MSFWLLPLRNPVAYLIKILSLRIRDRRTDLLRRDRGRRKVPHVSLDEETDAVAAVGVAAAGDDEESLDLTALLDVAERERGLRLWPIRSGRPAERRVGLLLFGP